MSMTPEQFERALRVLGLTQTKAAKLFGGTDRWVRKIIAGESAIPRSVEIVLRFMLWGKSSPDTVEDMMKRNVERVIVQAEKDEAQADDAAST